MIAPSLSSLGTKTDAAVKRVVARVPRAARRASELLVARLATRLFLPGLIRKRALQMRSGPGYLENVRHSTLAYVARNRRSDEGAGRYSFKPGGPSMLYASCYAALTSHLFGELEGIPSSEKAAWAQYIQSYQHDDGLFRDPVVACPLADQLDWWGWRHLSLHALMALSALDATAAKPFRDLDMFRKPGAMRRWLESRSWDVSAANVSNEAQNVGTYLQYARDYQDQSWCDPVLTEMYDWLDTTQDPATGLWGKRFDTPYLFSLGVQTGYHLWMLYFYDQRPVRYMERVVDSCLKTQNRLGGYGARPNSSACEDIDSIDILARFYHRTEYRKDDIQQSLRRALPWVLANQNDDGGWVFQRYAPLQYGHPLMMARRQESSMFPTWFRSLTLAYLFQVIDQSAAPIQWRFLKCPGHQFFHNPGTEP